MIVYTADRVGSFYRKYKHFKIMNFGVKMYVVKVGRDGIARYKYVGCVTETVTVDRFLRPKKEKLAKDLAAKNGGRYAERIRHNDHLDELAALALTL